MANQGLGQPNNGRSPDAQQNQEFGQNPYQVMRVINQQFPASEPRPEMTIPMQENTNHLGQAAYGCQSFIQTDGDPTIHNTTLDHPESGEYKTAIQCSDGGQTDTKYEVACGVQRDQPMIPNGRIVCPPAQKPSTNRPLASHKNYQRFLDNNDQRFLDEDEREASFKNAPSYSFKAPQLRPKGLAEMGFLYIGPEDKIKCYSCGVIIWKWEKDDDPLIEHVKHCPQQSLCQHLKNTYDIEFLKSIKDQKMVNGSAGAAYTSGPQRDQQTSTSTTGSGNTVGRHNATEPYICPDCQANRVDHAQLHCGHGICGACIQCMNQIPMTSRKCSTCNGKVEKYAPWCPGLYKSFREFN